MQKRRFLDDALCQSWRQASAQLSVTEGPKNLSHLEDLKNMRRPKQMDLDATTEQIVGASFVTGCSGSAKTP